MCCSADCPCKRGDVSGDERSGGENGGDGEGEGVNGYLRLPGPTLIGRGDGGVGGEEEGDEANSEFIRRAGGRWARFSGKKFLLSSFSSSRGHSTSLSSSFLLMRTGFGFFFPSSRCSFLCFKITRPLCFLGSANGQSKRSLASGGRCTPTTFQILKVT